MAFKCAQLQCDARHQCCVALFLFLYRLSCARTHTITNKFTKHTIFCGESGHAQFGFRVSLPQTCAIAASSKSLTSRNQFIIVFNSCQKHIYASPTLCPFGIWFTIISMLFIFFSRENCKQSTMNTNKLTWNSNFQVPMNWSGFFFVEIAIWRKAYTRFLDMEKISLWHKIREKNTMHRKKLFSVKKNL